MALLAVLWNAQSLALNTHSLSWLAWRNWLGVEPVAARTAALNALSDW